jgi:DNA-binding MarR family transcriptional regulator
MVRIRRSMTRRTLARLATRDTGQALDPGLTDVLDAVAEGPGVPDQAEPVHDASIHDVSVGLVATRLGIDPSRASRQVAAAIRAGYLRRVASQADGRRIHLELTELAEDIAEAAHRSRQRLYAELMRDWSATDRATFAGLLGRFTDALAETTEGLRLSGE